MADILGLKLFVKSDGTERLLSAYGNDIGVFDGASTFIGQSRNLSPLKMEFDVFLDLIVGVNGNDPNIVYNATTWLGSGVQTHMPIANLIKTVGSRMYLLDLEYVSSNFRSRVWYTDDEGATTNTLKWGYETGTNLAQTAGSYIVTSANAGFKTYGIKTGDIFVITTGTNAGVYHVDTIDADQQITLVEKMVNTATGSTYWAGSKWFDVSPSDGDSIKGAGNNDNKLLIFKRESLFRYDTREVRQVKGAPGTTSHRSIVNIKENTYYFHDTGIYRYDGSTSSLISRPIEDWIDGITPGSLGNVVAWPDGDFLYVFVGNVTNADRDISVTNCILIYDTAAQAWNIGRLNNVVRVATVAVESNTRNVYLGTADDKIILWNSGNADISESIEWSASTIYHFPGQAYNIIEFDRAEVHVLDGRGISIYFKLYGPKHVDEEWNPLGDLDDDVTEIIFPRGAYGRGVAYKFMENSTRKPPVITRIDTWYKDREGRNILAGA